MPAFHRLASERWHDPRRQASTDAVCRSGPAACPTATLLWRLRHEQHHGHPLWGRFACPTRPPPAGHGGPCGADPLAHQAGADVVELVEIPVADRQSAALARSRPDLDLEPQHVSKILFEGARIGILVRRAPTGAGAAIITLALALHQGLDGAHVQILRDDFLRKCFGILTADQGPSVAGG